MKVDPSPRQTQPKKPIVKRRSSIERTYATRATSKQVERLEISRPSKVEGKGEKSKWVPPSTSWECPPKKQSAKNLQAQEQDHPMPACNTLCAQHQALQQENTVLRQENKALAQFNLHLLEQVNLLHSRSLATTASRGVPPKEVGGCGSKAVCPPFEPDVEIEQVYARICNTTLTTDQLASQPLDEQSVEQQKLAQRPSDASEHHVWSFGHLVESCGDVALAYQEIAHGEEDEILIDRARHCSPVDRIDDQFNTDEMK